MNSRELRIGNYVEVESMMAEVVAILDHDGNDIEVQLSADYVINVNADVANPIVLTIDLLIAHCNFDNGWFIIGLSDHLYFLEFYEGYILLADTNHEPVMHFWDVKYLHRLQNLYFALRTEEIEIVFND